jgi:hypothetical protein
MIRLDCTGDDCGPMKLDMYCIAVINRNNQMVSIRARQYGTYSHQSQTKCSLDMPVNMNGHVIWIKDDTKQNV